MSKRLPICIVGCGGYAMTVMDDIRDMTDMAEFFFASRDIEKARVYCERYGGSGYFGSYEQAASDPRVGAMYFFTPHDRHLADGQLAARHGKHVLMEKPIARTVEEARKLIESAERARVTLMIAENFRFDPAVARAKELIEEGAVGELQFLDVRSEGMDIGVKGWRLSRTRTGGGRFIDGGIHYVDVLRNLAGHPELIYAVSQSPKLIPNIEGEDAITLTARFAGGLTGILRYSGGTLTLRKNDEVRVAGTKGRLRFAVFGNEVTLETSEGASIYPVEPAFRGVRGMLREFTEAVAQGREPVMNGVEGLNDLAVVLAAYESVRTGSVVPVADAP